jgi:hypothetical protein
MSYTDYDFPNTHFYESDLRELICMYKKLITEYNSLIAWKSQHEAEYSSLLQRVGALENEINTFEAQIEAQFEELKANLENYIFQEIHEALEQLIIELGEIRAELVQLRSDLTNEILKVNASIRAHDKVLRTWVDARLQQFIDSIPDLTTVNVWNPIKGRITSIQEAVNDLYTLARPNGLTAGEYDAMQLTATQYDALDITAFDYDNYARDIFGQRGLYKNPLYYMNSPFTGLYVPITTVINELAHLHKADALTAAEYDALDLTASDYDNYELTAYDFDWSGKLLLV